MMKTTTSPAISRRAPDHGFALIVVMSMVALITLLAVGLVSLAARSTASSNHLRFKAEAEANALLGLRVALGDLQATAGPDQRVTAPAAVVGDAENPHWTGVWSTVVRERTGEASPSQPIVGGHEGGRRTPPQFLVDARETMRDLSADRWRDNLRLAWLVSGDPTRADTSPSSMIEIVGEASVGQDEQSRVRVPRVDVGTTGGYAFWVSDESTKAKINIGNPWDGQASSSNPTSGSFWNLTGAASPNPATVEASGNTPFEPLARADAETKRKVVNFNQAGLLLGSADIRPNFHDLTTHSYGIPANVRLGGLKLDLTALLEQPRNEQEPIGVELSSNPMNLRTVQPGDSISPFTSRRFSAPRFDDLAAWYQLMDSANGQVGTTEHPPTHSPPRTPTTNHAFAEGMTVDSARITGVGNRRQAAAASTPLHPIVADFKYSFDFSLDTSRGDGRAIRSHVYPRLVLWNPYNTTIEAPRYVITMISPHSFTGRMQVGGQAPEPIPGHPQAGNRFPTPGANYMAFTVEPTTFGPGEALVFTPDISASGGTRLHNNSVEYVASDFSRNRLSAQVAPGNQNFHFNSGVRAPSSVNVGNTPAISFAGGVNQALSYNQIFLLKRAPTNSGSIAPADLSRSSGATFDTVHRIYPNYNGTRDSIWWLVLRESNHAANNAIPLGLAAYEPFARNRRPPRLWYQQFRLRWLDESLEQQSLGQNWGVGAAVWYHAPNIAHFNVRAQTVFRSPFCFYHDWTRYSPGAFMVPWVSPQDNDTRPPFVEGRALGSPFGPDHAFAAVGGSYPLFDVPHPDVGVLSLASFQHAPLSRFSWQPSMVVGHSLAEPRADRDATVNRAFNQRHSNRTEHPWNNAFAKHTPGQWGDLIQLDDLATQTGAPEVFQHDMIYEVNHFLWDDFFLSSIPYSRGGSSTQITWNPADPLPNSRHVLNPWMGINQETLRQWLSNPPAPYASANRSAYPFHHAAYFLMKDGAFNVNSTSVEAWRAVFSALRDTPRPTLDSSAGVEGMFSRLLVPHTSEPAQAHNSAGTWQSGRQLTDQEIGRLAEAMVDEVRLRGPFLSMGDFVNRRLKPGMPLDPRRGHHPDDTSVRGALQAAIERAGLNSRLQRSTPNYQTDRTDAQRGGGGIAIPDHDAMVEWKLYGAPGYLTQADVLQAIGPQLTARGDTFVIRVYGEKKADNGRVLATAWAEAVVQRLPDYVDAAPIDDFSGNSGGNHPAEAFVIDTRDRTGAQTGVLAENPNISDINRRFGRQFTIRSFRWLSQDEI